MDGTELLPMNPTPSPRPSPPLGENVPGGRLRGIPIGSWPNSRQGFLEVFPDGEGGHPEVRRNARSKFGVFSPGETRLVARGYEFPDSALSNSRFSLGPYASFNASARAAGVIFFHDFCRALTILSSSVFAASSVS